MIRYIKDNEIFTINQVNRLGLSTAESRSEAGFDILDEHRPPYDPNTQTLVSGPVTDGAVTWTIEALSDDVIASNLARVMESAISDLKVHTKALIAKGYDSEALGTAHHYDSDKVEDSINTIGVKVLGKDFNFTCTEVATGIKGRKMHTKTQLNKIYTDGVAHIDGYKALIWVAIDLVKAATTATAILTIVTSYKTDNPL